MYVEPPYSAACERNREPILAQLRGAFADRRRVLEIGSGTGQHAVHFAPALPALVWQTSEVAEHLPGIRAQLARAQRPNTPPPLEFDVDGPWPSGRYDAIYTANTHHIMSWAQVCTLYARLPEIVADDAVLAVYGPFAYGGAQISASNAAFDAQLRARATHMGIRDFEAVDALARGAGFALQADHALPANNRLLVWRRAR